MAIDKFTKLSNVIGAPFPEYVLRQLSIRAYRSSTGNISQFGVRTNEELLYLANKTAWVRFISSVDLEFPPGSSYSTADYKGYLKALGIENSGIYNDEKSLAKNWILQAGTSIQNGNGVTLRQGLGPNGAYGLGGTEELGYRPMPGLSSITVDTAGRLGSLRTATINFQVWNMNQLNVIEALYFRLGYSMLLEWGHTQYFKNYGKDLQTETTEGVFVSKEVYGINDPFRNNRRKEDIQQEIAAKRYETSGNYDGMLGIVVNFNWSYNQDGGYDCSVKLVGMGAIIDSVRINQAYTLPRGILKKFKNSEDAIAAYVKRVAEQAAKDAINKAGGPGPGSEPPPIDPAPKNRSELLAREKKYDNFNGGDAAFQNTYSPLSFPAVNPTVDNYQRFNGTSIDYIAAFRTPQTGITAFDSKEAQTKYGGLYLNRGGQFIYVGNAPTPIKLDIKLISRFIEGIQVDDRSLDPGLPRISAGFASGWKQVYPGGATFLVPLRAEVGRRGYDFNGFTAALAWQLSVKSEEVNEGVRIATSNNYVSLVDTPQATRSSSNASLNNRKWEDTLKVSDGTEYNVFVDFNYTVPVGDALNLFQTSLIEVVDAIAKFSSSDGQALLSKVDFIGGPTSPSLATFEIGFQITVRSYFKGGTPNAGQIASFTRNNIPKDSNGNYYQDYPGKITFKTNNPAFILGPGTPPAAGPTSNTTTAADQGSSAAAEQVATDKQVSSDIGFESALHAMLTTVQTVAQAQAIKSKAGIVVVPITEDTKQFFKGGALDGVLDLTGTQTVPTTFDLKLYAAKGFSSQLMTNPENFNNIPYVGGDKDKPDFAKLCQSVVIKYLQNNIDQVQYPGQYQTYIPLGYLLAFINNMCLFYDTKEKQTNAATPPPSGNQKRPYVYLDFNPETNFCLTSPEQFSVDPNICIVPANLTQKQYLSIFPENIQPKNPWNPDSANLLTQVIDNSGLSYKSKDTTYRGKTMHILVCTQYLLKLLKEFSTGNPQHAVALQPYLDRIMKDVNKSLGNTNLFRVAYRDDTNTVQIQDDQYVPRLLEDKTVLERTTFLEKLQEKSLESGELPLFASQIQGEKGPLAIPSLGIAREMQLRTVMSTKMASMLAISAQAATSSINATDHSEFSWLNQNFKDRYKPYIEDASKSSATPPPPNKVDKTNNQSSNTPPVVKANDQEAADKFDDHVQSVYKNYRLLEDAINAQKNYYIERMSKVKSEDAITSAAPFIPAEIEITMDGISGIIMGNAFNIPPQRLPNTYKQNGFPRVGFIVNGLTHTVENNEWVTKIKGQMIKLREQSGLKASVAIPTGKQTDNPLNGSTGGGALVAGGGTVDFTAGTCTRQSLAAVNRRAAEIQALKKALIEGGITGKYALASIIAVAGGESGWDPEKIESYKYSDTQFATLFGLSQDQQQRAIVARNKNDGPGVFAIIYGERQRAGNRNAEDGRKYYGRGYMQLTGWENYDVMGRDTGLDLVNNPDLVASKQYAGKVAAAYYKRRIGNVDQNDPDYMNKAVAATGKPVRPEVKADYYACLIESNLI